ncbi:helix-turn-helix transcriptional regulator [Pararhizobium sp.]|uniref:helix-turn-helix transcriptional regulator n=1 Tax=Pararhizobium sp. TaxID=1977563 RepID=UPI002717CCBD|nr:helix-turn-helix domain-containing protein [Pararhizobium sp.]MDO9417229.1 helix-turn-helix domain-containing protein [Pararhizobium sp.]
MNIQTDLPRDHMRRQLLERLRPLIKPREAGHHRVGEQLFSYCCLDRERLAAVQLPHPIIGVLLRGYKEVWLGDIYESFHPGDVFVLPGRVPLDVVNVPGEAAGIYESLLFSVPVLPDGVPPLPSARDQGNDQADAREFSIALTPDLIEALSHAATGIADGGAGAAIGKLRLAEVLLLLRPMAAARPLFRTDLAEEVALLIGSAPSEDWTVERVARHLGLGPSTLRRRLTAAGRPFRTVLRDERLRAGRSALAAGASSLAAAEAAGYTSRSHFSRRYRETFGTTPGGRV